MRQSTKGVVIVILVIGLGACRRTEFKGDGRLIDRGFWAAVPRYVIELQPEIRGNADEPDTTYRFTGAVSDESTVSFRASTSVTPHDMRRSAASLRVTLREAGGRSVCGFESRIADLKMWTKGGAPIELWSPSCNMVRLDETRAYELRVSVVGRAASDTWRLMPTIISGGWDSP